MKKKLYILLFLLLFAPFNCVNADDNRFYFFENKGKLYYDTSYINEDYFIKHLDMVPGKKYTDYLIIGNGTNDLYNVYMRVVPEDRDEEEDELIDNILMELYLDDKLIYDGIAKGLDYSNSGVNLQEAIFLGEFKSGMEKTLKVTTRLANLYSNTENRSTLDVKWQFYVEYNGEVIEVIDAPNTLNNRASFIPVVAILLMIFGVSIVFYVQLRNEKNNKQ